jgi:hypothetical protein
VPVARIAWRVTATVNRPEKPLQNARRFPMIPPLFASRIPHPAEGSTSMFKHSRAVFGVVALCGLADLAGCTSKALPPPPAPGPRFDNGYTSWAADSSKADQVRGIDFGMVEWALWNDDVVFAVWVDKPGAIGASGGHVGSFGRNITPAKTEGGGWQVSYQVLVESPAAVVECKTTDGKTGTVTVNRGQSYDLAAGRLFLLSTAGGSVKLKQLSREGLTGKPGAVGNPPEVYVKLRDDADIRAFYAKGGEKEKSKGEEKEKK